MPRLADIVRRVGHSYLARFGDRVLPSHRQAIRDIGDCRSPDMGGHVEECDACDHRGYFYHSCRNRHCPTCQGDRVQRWINRHLRLLLPCPYQEPVAHEANRAWRAARRHLRRCSSLK